MHIRMKPSLQCIFLCLLAARLLALGCPTAWAMSVSVGELRLEYALPWERAGAGEESEAESAILRRSDTTAPLTVMLPRHHTRLRMPEEHFYRQLEMVWRGRYGEAARMDWLDAGGRRWRWLRRPSLDRAGAVVFHLVTVIDGRAHHLLAYAPASTTELPEAVIGLLSGPVGAQGNGDTPGSFPAAPATAPSMGWRLERIVHIRPGQAELDRMMTLERDGLGREGGITGLALKVKEQGIEAFLQGFVWVPGPGRREVRHEFLHRWELTWAAPPSLWRDDEAAAMAVSSGAGSDRVGLGIGLRFLCAEADRLGAMLDDAQRGEAGAGERLEAAFASCRDKANGLTQAEVTLSPGEAARPVVLQAPDYPALSAGERGLLVLTLQPRVGQGSPGQALLGAASVHYVYERVR